MFFIRSVMAKDLVFWLIQIAPVKMMQHTNYWYSFLENHHSKNKLYLFFFDWIPGKRNFIEYHHSTSISSDFDRSRVVELLPYIEFRFRDWSGGCSLISHFLQYCVVWQIGSLFLAVRDYVRTWGLKRETSAQQFE